MEPVAAIEIGTTKVVAMVGEMPDDGPLMITGIGSVPSSGVRKGQIIDFENATVCIKSALDKAENASNVSLGSVYVSVSGGHIRGDINSGSAPLMDDGVVTLDDMDEVCDIARALPLPEHRQIIHSIPRFYQVDDQVEIVNPEGMVGTRLSLEMLVLHSSIGQLKNISKALDEVQLEVIDAAFSGLCAAQAVLTQEQKRLGAVVVDLGGGTTDYMAYENGAVVCGGSLGIGGDHITNDLAVAFKMPIARAERLKKEYGSAVIEQSPKVQKILLPSEMGMNERSVSTHALQVVINARMRETLEMVRKRLDDADVLPKAGAGVILTGGGARLKGVEKLAEQVFGAKCFIGVPRDISGMPQEIARPENATCCGLVKYGFQQQRHAEQERGGSLLGNIVKSIFGG